MNGDRTGMSPYPSPEQQELWPLFSQQGATGRPCPASTGGTTRPGACERARRSGGPALPAPPASASARPPRRSPPSGAMRSVPDPCRPLGSSVHGGADGTGGMKRRLPTTRKGEPVLAAISLPPLTDDANRHAPSPGHPGNPAAAANAAPTAASANRPACPAGRIASPPSSTASAAKPAPSSGARAPDRRTQPRAVVYPTPAPAAAGRTPHAPPATCPITAPTVSATSSRQASTNAGSNAWLTRHGPHRTLGTKIFGQRPPARPPARTCRQ